MSQRRASCVCGQLRVECKGDPVRVSMCHCFACQQRSGSVYAVQARFRREDITAIEGRSQTFIRKGDESGIPTTFHFCPECGSTVYYVSSQQPELVAIAVGAFTDPNFPAPVFSVYEERSHPWAVPRGIPMEHMD
ncbi:GFA family protein [Corallococcus exiguus]|uniref:GFA family protein n=1 Tax=Corallococcus TaxID=83461 RepID=UPI000EEDCE9C|nr:MULTISPECIES: GFA family protein [Corallococcus]NPC71508.1 GFA family protein [Corallococcus exiguus]NRD45306.1 GFA family protein [Corallococcus exiguus]RKH94972.1 GFA family protein [Corallococcus sp. AB038B]